MAKGRTERRAKAAIGTVLIIAFLVITWNKGTAKRRTAMMIVGHALSQTTLLMSKHGPNALSEQLDGFDEIAGQLDTVQRIVADPNLSLLSHQYASELRAATMRMRSATALHSKKLGDQAVELFKQSDRTQTLLKLAEWELEKRYGTVPK